MIKGLLICLALLCPSLASYENGERRRWLEIGSCTSDSLYEGYECEKSYDGIIQEGKNGWSIPSSSNMPQSVTLQLKEPSAINRVVLRTLWEDQKYRVKTFKITLIKDWKDSGKEHPQENVIVVGSPSAIVNGPKVTLTSRMDQVDVSFKRSSGVTAVRLTVYETFDSSAVITEILLQNVPEAKKCKTVGGPQRNRECIFPFVNPYTKAVHYGCTTEYGLPPWCATRVNSDSSMTIEGSWFFGFCDETCEQEEINTCYTTWSQSSDAVFSTNKNEIRRSCIFPFLYEGIWHNQCVKGSNGIPFCPTTVNEKGEVGDRGYCGPECPGSELASQCVAGSGYSSSKGSRCVFPAKYEDTYILKCGDYKYNDKAMCATSLGADGYTPVSGQFAYCGEANSCDANECITVGGKKVGEACRFPFRNPWTKELHFNCTSAALEDGSSDSNYASAPWCATDTEGDDEMVSGAWGFCSKKCSVEKQNNCFVDDGTSFSSSKRCIFPFVYKGLRYDKCTFVKRTMMCPIKVDKYGVAAEKDMKPCGPSKQCKANNNLINGNVVVVGYKPVGSYTNTGSVDLEFAFSFETGVEDTSESNWNVEASVTVGFEAFGASVEGSVTAGGGGGSSSSSSTHTTHSLTYKCPPQTRVVLNQKVLTAGAFQSRTFELILVETKLPTKTTTSRMLTEDEMKRIESKQM